MGRKASSPCAWDGRVGGRSRRTKLEGGDAVLVLPTANAPSTRSPCGRAPAARPLAPQKLRRWPRLQTAIRPHCWRWAAGPTPPRPLCLPQPEAAEWMQGRQSPWPACDAGAKRRGISSRETRKPQRIEQMWAAATGSGCPITTVNRWTSCAPAGKPRQSMQAVAKMPG